MCDFLDRDLFPVWGGGKVLIARRRSGDGENVHDQGTRTDLYEIFKHHSKEIRNLLFVRLLHLARRGRGAQSPEKNDKIRVVRTHPNRRSNRIRRNPGFPRPRTAISCRWYVMVYPTSSRAMTEELDRELARRQRDNEPLFEYFAPILVEAKKINGRLVRTRRPLLYNYLFVHASEAEIYRIKQAPAPIQPATAGKGQQGEIPLPLSDRQGHA